MATAKDQIQKTGEVQKPLLDSRGNAADVDNIDVEEHGQHIRRSVRGSALESVLETPSIEREEKELTERIEVCAKLPSGEPLVKLVDEIAQVPDSFWNNARNYSELFLTLLPYATKSRHETFLEIMRRYQENLTQKMEPTEALQILSQSMKDGDICRGISIAELGGTFTRDLFGKLGAEVTLADSGLAGDAGMTYLPVPESIVTWENYKRFFPKNYDIVCTNNVRTLGSGIEEAEKLGGIPMQDWLALEYMLAKKRGAIFNVVNKNHFSEEAEFRFEAFKKGEHKKLQRAYEKEPKRVIIDGRVYTPHTLREQNKRAADREDDF